MLLALPQLYSGMITLVGQHLHVLYTQKLFGLYGYGSQGMRVVYISLKSAMVLYLGLSPDNNHMASMLVCASRSSFRVVRMP